MNDDPRDLTRRENHFETSVQNRRVTDNGETNCDPRDYLKKEKHEEICNTHWSSFDDWKDDFLKEYKEQTIKIALMSNTLDTVKGIVYGTIKVIGVAFLLGLIFVAGWKGMK
jgi:hypothetical protein